MDDAQLKARIEQIFAQLDAYTYYELLKVQPTATPDEIRAAFHRMAMTMHPDRYQHYGDKEVRDQLYTIYKRVTEGYRVLLDDQTRKRYDEGLSKGERRLEQTERKRTGIKRVDKDIPPNARKFFLLGQDAERRGDNKNAKINYKFALDLAPEHPVIMKHYEAVSEKPKTEESKPKA